MSEDDAICNNCGTACSSEEIQCCERCGTDGLGNCCIGQFDHDCVDEKDEEENK